MTQINFGLKIGDICKLEDNPNYAKIINIDYYGKSYKIAKCEWSQQINDCGADFGLIKYFRLSSLKKLK